jgi:MFS family permease
MINDISEDLDTTVTGVQTAITLFLLIMAIFMIPASKLSDRWGRKRCFNAGLLRSPISPRAPRPSGSSAAWGASAPRQDH